MSDDDLPRGDAPGAGSTPFADGKGTIGLEDRLGDAAPDTNQGRTEPLSPTPDHPEPAAPVPTLDDMNVGSNDPGIARPSVLASPTAPSLVPTEGVGDAAGVPVTSPDAMPGTSEQQPGVSG